MRFFRHPKETASGISPGRFEKPELTASWEMELAKIAKGAHKEQVFIKDIESYTKELIQDIKTSDGTSVTIT